MSAIATLPIKRYAIFGGLSVFALLVGCGSYFTVDQTELGNVRRFGVVQYPKDQPVGPGFHLKLPLIDTADTVQITLQTIHIPPFDVLTVDNQKVTIEENFNYTIPPSQAYHFMYEVGRPGTADSVDFQNQIIPVAHDRTARIFAGENMVTVNAEREKIQEAVESSIKTSVENLFGITAHSLQISAIKPSDNFMASIDRATMAKNDAIAAENKLRTVQFEAQQAAENAKGIADAAIESARGQAQSVRLNAQANKDATVLAAEARKQQLVLEGDGLKANLAAQIEPFGGSDKYVDYLHAKAALNWNGATPQIVSGSSGGPNLIIPVPSAARGQ